MSGIGNSSCIRVSSSGAWLPNGRLYKDLSLGIFMWFVVGTNKQTMIVLVEHGCAEISVIDQAFSRKESQVFVSREDGCWVRSGISMCNNPLLSRCSVRLGQIIESKKPAKGDHQPGHRFTQ